MFGHVEAVLGHKSKNEGVILSSVPGINAKIKKRKVEHQIEQRVREARHEQRNRWHKPLDQYDVTLEIKLKKTATRGVVKLFNAITAQQRQGSKNPSQNSEIRAEQKKVGAVSKRKFLEMLKGAPKAAWLKEDFMSQPASKWTKDDDENSSADEQTESKYGTGQEEQDQLDLSE